MAAIDPSEEPEHDTAVDKQKVRSTLKVVRMIDEGDSEDDFEDDEEDSEEDDEEVNGGPSTKVPSKQEIAKAIADLAAEEDDEDDDEDMDEDSEDEEAAQALLAKLMKDARKGKSKAVDGEEDDSEDEDAESVEMDEVVVCTLDPEKVCSSPIYKTVQANKDRRHTSNHSTWSLLRERRSSSRSLVTLPSTLPVTT